MLRSADDSYLRRGAVALGAAALGGYLVEYGFNLGLTRMLPPHEYGDFKVAAAFAFFFGLAVLLGGDRAAPMVLAPSLERGETRRVGEYIRLYLGNALLLSLVVIALTWTFSFLHVGSADPLHHHALAWAVIAVPINAAAAMISRTMQSARHPARAILPWRFGLPAVQLALLGILFLVRGEVTVFEAIEIGVAAAGLMTLWQWIDVRRLHLVDFRREPAFREPKAWLAASLPMMGSFLVALALNENNLYFLELLGDEAEVGHYAAAAVAAHILPVAQVTVVGLVAPIARPAIEAGAASSRATFRRSLGLMLGIILPLGLLVAFLGNSILSLFGPQYRVGQAVLRFLVIGNFAWASAGLSSLWLQYRGHAGVVLAISITTLVADSALNLLLIPRFGMVGAAASTALTLTGAAVAVVVAHWRSQER